VPFAEFVAPQTGLGAQFVAEPTFTLMKLQTRERTEIVRAACRKHPKLPNKTLARMIYRQHPIRFDNLESVRHAVRWMRGNNGKKSRQAPTNTDTRRPNGEAGFVWQFPKSIAPSYEPFILDSSDTLVLSDLHIPFHDSAAIHAAIGVAKHRPPSTILLNGDVCDFFSASRFDRNPTESSLKKEFNLTRQFLGWLRQSFPKVRIIYKLGNHDEWFEKYLLRKAPELFGVDGISLSHLLTGKIGTLPEIGGIEWVDDQQRIKIGALTIWHGHEIGKGSIAPPVNPARGLFMRTLDCGLMGHLHKGSNHEETTSNGKLVTTWSTGCLCGLWPRYARVNKWTHGAAFVELHGAKNFSVTPIRILRGEVL
jgi:predicted phosphodiesterase